MISLRISCYFVIAGLLGLSAPAQVVPVPVAQDVIDDYTTFLAGRSATEIQGFSGPASRRDVVELVLLQQALRAGGSDLELEWVPVRSYKQILRDVGRGRFVLAGNTVWLQDAQAVQGARSTAALIREGEFLAGFYTSKGNVKALSATSVDELLKLTAVSNSHWTRDWETLQQLGFAEPRNVRSWESMVRQLAAQRSDLTLAPFNADTQMCIRLDNCVLCPIQGFKTNLRGERVWIVSARHAEGAALYRALRRGIAALRESGTIRRAYTECGFFNPAVADWLTVRP